MENLIKVGLRPALYALALCACIGAAIYAAGDHSDSPAQPKSQPRSASYKPIASRKLSPMPVPAGYEGMAIDDLKVGIGGLLGKRVVVKGLIYVAASDYGYLGARALDSSDILVGFAEMPRGVLKRLLSKCDARCLVDIKGHIGPTLLGRPGVVIEDMFIEE